MKRPFFFFLSMFPVFLCAQPVDSAAFGQFREALTSLQDHPLMRHGTLGFALQSLSADSLMY